MNVKGISANVSHKQIAMLEEACIQIGRRPFDTEGEEGVRVPRERCGKHSGFRAFHVQAEVAYLPRRCMRPQNRLKLLCLQDGGLWSSSFVMAPMMLLRRAIVKPFILDPTHFACKPEGDVAHNTVNW